jgi:hypothetical protein
LGAILFGIFAAGLIKLFSYKIRLNETLSWVPHPEEIQLVKDDPKWMI